LAAASVAIVMLARPQSTTTQSATESAEPARVVTGSSPSELSFDDVHVALDADSALVMPRDGSTTALLEHGAAWFTVAPRGTRQPFIVLAGDTTVRVIGTKFRVLRDGERGEVSVDHGVVEVSYHGTIVRVG